MKKENKRKKFVDKSLTYKMSVAIGIVLTFMLALLICISAYLARTGVSRGINGEFQGIAAQNGISVQSILDTASSAAKDLRSYMQHQYDLFDEEGGIYSGEPEKSSVYDVELQHMNASIEEYILNTAWSLVGNDDDICGIGVYFEPNAFDPSIKDYSIYVDEEAAANKTARSYGSYAEYGSANYYKEAASSKDSLFTEPYVDNGITMVTVAFPILHGEEVQGVITVDINVDNFSKLKTTDTKYPSMYVDVYNQDFTIVYDSEGSEYINKNLEDLLAAEEFAKITSIAGTESFHVSTLKADGSKLVRYFYPINAEGTTWWAASALEETDLNKSSNELLIIMVALGIVSLIIIVVAVIVLLKKFLSPIAPVVSAASKLAAGDFNIELSAENEDEIGALTHAFSSTVNNLSVIVSDLTKVLQEMSTGNFDITQQADYVGDFKIIDTSISSFLLEISKTLNDINYAAEQVAEGSSQIASGAQALTEGATDQAGSIQELQATLTNISGDVDTNAKQADSARKMARNVGDNIIDSNNQMKEMVQAMEVITTTSTQISDIINVINGIAEQTNLLALNASIEAARAGDAGRGFAVVATEVGNLAAQSAEAAKNSTKLIQDSIQAVENGRTLVERTAKRLDESQEKTVELAENIALISEASIKQAESLDQITKAIEQIASVVEENTAMAEESSASSEELASQSQVLKDLVSKFTLNRNI